VIKIEYRRALQQNVIPAPCPRSLPCFAPVFRETDAVELYLSRCSIGASLCPCTLLLPGTSATIKPQISIFSSAVLPGTSQYVECDVTHSKQTTAPFLPGTRIARQPLQPSPKITQSALRNSAFLTGSDLQTEIDVTSSKQTTEKFLTGARTAISVSRKHTSNRELTMRRASASPAMRGICFALSNRELLELEHAPTN
jgi:hypothetical protein